MMILLFILSLWSASVQAQEFSVAGFRLLPNDVSAFITPVRDLNDEPCALVKVEAPSDFAFSTPLGIVSRKDKVGEIWLYLPKGSKLLTIKHPEWGVLRDYRFSKPLESRMTYELKLKLPKPTPIIQEKHDTIVEVKTVIDTIAIPQVRKKMPLALYTLATLSLHEDGPSYGLFFALMHRHGFFIHASSNLKSIGSTEGTCNKEGFTPGSSIKPYYTGNTRHQNYTFTAGAIHHITHGFCLFEGVGYGKAATAWQQTESSGGGYLLNEDLTDVHLAAGGMVGPYHHEAAENQIVQGTFAGCEKLTHLVLPADATTIEKDAFADCTSLREIEIPASAGSILPSSGCTALEALTVSPANANYKSQDGVLLNAEGNRIIWFPMGKKGKYTLPSAFTSIGAYAFKECSIEAFYLSDNVETLGQGAFMDSQIKEIHLGAGIKLIPTGVFQGCRKLTKVYLGANTEQISNYAFDGSPLTDLYVSASMIPYCEENAFANKVEGFFATCVLHVPAGMKKKYQNHKIWGKFTHIVEE